MKSVEFGTLFKFIRNGMSVRQDRSGKGLPITRIETISLGVVDDTRVGYADLEENNCAGWLLEPGDILFSHINSVEHIGKCAVYEGTPRKLVHGMNLLCLRPDKKKLDSQFAKYLIRGNAFRVQLSSFVNKAVNQASVSIGNLKTIPVEVPPLDEQRRLAAILDKADVIRRKRVESFHLTDQLLRSSFLEMFGDPVTNPNRWDIVPIKELGNVMTGNTPPREIQEYYGEGIEWIKSDNINTPHHFLTEAKEYLTPAGQRAARIVPAKSTLVTCIAGSPECIGNAALANRPVAFNQQINAITPFKDVDPYFLYVHILVSKKQIQEQSTESMKGMVSKGKFENVSFIKPPLKLQQNFSNVFSHFHDMLTKYILSNVETENIFNSLAQRAFRGGL